MTENLTKSQQNWFCEFLWKDTQSFIITRKHKNMQKDGIMKTHFLFSIGTLFKTTMI